MSPMSSTMQKNTAPSLKALIENFSVHRNVGNVILYRSMFRQLRCGILVISGDLAQIENQKRRHTAILREMK